MRLSFFSLREFLFSPDLLRGFVTDFINIMYWKQPEKSHDFPLLCSCELHCFSNLQPSLLSGIRPIYINPFFYTAVYVYKANLTRTEKRHFFWNEVQEKIPVNKLIWLSSSGQANHQLSIFMLMDKFALFVQNISSIFTNQTSLKISFWGFPVSVVGFFWGGGSRLF